MVTGAFCGQDTKFYSAGDGQAFGFFFFFLAGSGGDSGRIWEL